MVRHNNFTKQIIKELEDKGYKVCCVNFDSRHLDSLWYGGWVMTLEKNGHSMHILANGEVRANYSKGEEYDYMVDKNHAGDFASWAKGHGLKTDLQIHDAECKGILFYWNNNWFEAFDETDGYEVLETEINDTDGLDEMFKYFYGEE